MFVVPHYLKKLIFMAVAQATWDGTKFFFANLFPLLCTKRF